MALSLSETFTHGYKLSGEEVFSLDIEAYNEKIALLGFEMDRLLSSLMTGREVLRIEPIGAGFFSLSIVQQYAGIGVSEWAKDPSLASDESFGRSILSLLRAYHDTRGAVFVF